MAIDARIPLAAQPTDTNRPLASFIALQRNQIADEASGYRNELLEAQTAGITASTEAAGRREQRDVTAQKGAFLHRAMTQWKTLPPGPVRRDSMVAAERLMRDAGLLEPGETFSDDPDDDDAWLDAGIAATAAFKPQGAFQKGASGLVKDSKGNLFHTTNGFDPTTGTSQGGLEPVIPGGPASPQGPAYPVDSAGLTMAEGIDKARDTASEVKQVQIRQGIAKDAFDAIGRANTAIANYDSGIKAIKDGANTGPVAQWFPSFRASTIELQNAANRMGLDIISAVTFGALSAGEMKLAMDTAMPMGLEEDDLIAWLGKRKRAQHKLRAEMMKMASHFEANGSIDDYLEQQKVHGNYVNEADLPMITDQKQFDVMESGSYYLSRNEDGDIIRAQKP